MALAAQVAVCTAVEPGTTAPSPLDRFEPGDNNNDIEVRLLSRSDADVLMRADDDVFDARFAGTTSEAFLADSNSVIAVALDRDTVVGMASAITYRHPDKPLQMFVNESESHPPTSGAASGSPGLVPAGGRSRTRLHGGLGCDRGR